MDLGPTPTTAPGTARTTAETELADDTDDTLRPWLLIGAVVGVVMLITGLVLVRRSRAAAPEGTSRTRDPI